MANYTILEHEYAADTTDQELAQAVIAHTTVPTHSCEVYKKDDKIIVRVWYRQGMTELVKPSAVSATELGQHIKNSISGEGQRCEIKRLQDQHDNFRVTDWPEATYIVPGG